MSRVISYSRFGIGIFITDLNTASLEVFKRRHIEFLIRVSNARVLIKPVTIDQSEGIQERPFVKFPHRRSFAFPRRASTLVSYAVPQLTERLVEARTKCKKTFLISFYSYS